MLLPWPAHAKSMARAWQARAWQEQGYDKGMARALLQEQGYDKGMFVPWYCCHDLFMPLPCILHILDVHAIAMLVPCAGLLQGMARILPFLALPCYWQALAMARAWQEHGTWQGHGKDMARAR
jgi:hypothetical protein